MKYYLLSLGAFLFSLAFENCSIIDKKTKKIHNTIIVNSKNIDTVEYIRSIVPSFKDYRGKKVKEFLSYLRIKPISYNFIDEPPGSLSFVLFNFTDGISIGISPKDIKYQKRRKPDYIDNPWNLELFLEEEIDEIKLYDALKIKDK